jgi:hypothetical protein
MDFGGSGDAEAPIELSDCEFDAGAVGLVIGSYDPNQESIKHVRVHDNDIRACSNEYGIGVVVQGHASQIQIERNIIRRGRGGLSLYFPVADKANGIVFRYNTFADIKFPFLFNDSIIDQDIRIERNLVADGQTLHTNSGSPLRYQGWLLDNDWIEGPDVDTGIVENMFTTVRPPVLQSLDASSPEFLKPTKEAARFLGGLYYIAN